MAERADLNPTLKSVGFSGLTVEEAMKYFRYILESNPIAIAVAKIDWDVLIKNRPDLNGILLTANALEENLESNEAVKFDVQEIPAAKMLQSAIGKFETRLDLEGYL